jgi:hypothetical protein
MEAQPELFGKFLQHPDDYKIQIIYTQIDRRADNSPVFTDHTYRLNSKEYFYPASTVKLPTAMLALQRLNELNLKGLDKNTAMVHGADYKGQIEALNDPSSPNGFPSIEHYIKKILLVSDNDAFNRLYEFLGSKYINQQLHQKGYSDAQVIHRLERSLTEDENRHTNPVYFYDPKNNPIYKKPLEYDETIREKRTDFLGKAYMKNQIKVEGPMDFSTKNRLGLQSLHQIVKSVIFPQTIPASSRFGLTGSDYDFIRKYMSMYPPESSIPGYDTAAAWPAYCKFLLWGAEKGEKPSHIRVFNKVGDAYGFLIDAAYIVDFEKKVEFMLSAVIYCNKDGVLNDSQYDYDEIGFPFMKNLGELIYQHELKRKKAFQPNLVVLLRAIKKQ